MAVVKPSVLGTPSGRLGNIVVYEVKGQVRMRLLPADYKDPKSPAQVAQRGRVKGVAALYRSLQFPLRDFWKKLAEGTMLNGYNLFLKANIANVAGDGNVADWKKVVLCDGTLRLPEGVKVEEREGGEVVVEWDARTKDWREMKEVMQVAIYGLRKTCKTPQVWVDAAGGAEWREGRMVWKMPAEARGKCRAYGFFREPYGGAVSRSFYIGEFEGKEAGEGNGTKA